MRKPKPRNYNPQLMHYTFYHYYITSSLLYKRTYLHFQTHLAYLPIFLLDNINTEQDENFRKVLDQNSHIFRQK